MFKLGPIYFIILQNINNYDLFCIVLLYYVIKCVSFDNYDEKHVPIRLERFNSTLVYVRVRVFDNLTAPMQ